MEYQKRKGLSGKELRAFWVQECKAAFQSSIEMLPDADAVANLSGAIDLVKSGVRNRFFKKLSKESATKMEDILDGVSFSTPPSREDFTLAVGRSLDKDILLMEKAQRLTPAATRLELMNRTVRAMNWGRDLIVDLCSSQTVEPWRDQVDTAERVVKLSAPGVHTDSVYTVIAHEIFHILDPYFNLQSMSSHSKEWIREVKDCLLSQHGSSSGRFDGTQFLAEDWADFGSNLLDPKAAVRSWCSELNLQPIAAQNGFVAMDIRRTHPHSPYFFRLLHSQVYTSEGLPASCRKFLSKNPDIQIKRCIPL